jgi:hypothetical protein
MVEAGNRTNVHVKTLIDEQGFGESPTRGINSVVADFAQDLELDTQQGATEFHNCISNQTMAISFDTPRRLTAAPPPGFQA